VKAKRPFSGQEPYCGGKIWLEVTRRVHINLSS
jgi:hypothetical protein